MSAWFPEASQVILSVNCVLLSAEPGHCFPLLKCPSEDDEPVPLSYRITSDTEQTPEVSDQIPEKGIKSVPTEVPFLKNSRITE